MDFKHIIKRGLEANLPVLDDGEIAYTKDTKRYWIGSPEGNIPFSNKTDVEDYVSGEIGVVNAQLAKKPSKEELQAVASGSPKGVYSTLTALQNAFPTGTTGIYVVSADGKWYYWNVTAWTAGGTYQSTGIADKTITLAHMSDEVNKGTWNKARAKSNSGIKRIYVEKIYDIESYRGSLAVGNLYNARFSFLQEGTTINNIRTTLFINDINTLGQLGNAKRIDSTYVVPQANTVLNYSQPTGVYATSDLRYVHVLLSLDGDTDLGFIDFFFKNCKLFIGSTEIIAIDTFGFYLCDPTSAITPNQYLGNEFATIKTLEQKISAIEVISPDSQWKSKTWYSFGDSITWQDGNPYGTGSQVGQIAKGYQTLVKEKLGVNYTNKGVNGNICQWMINDFKNSDKNFDVASFFIGTNDFMKHIPLGTLGDTANTTFYGCLDVLCKEIANTTPSKTVFFMTPLKRWGYVYESKATTMTNDEGVHLSAYVQAMKEVCGGVYGYPVLDLNSMSQINQYNINTYTRDGLHPIDIGYRKFGSLIAQFMNGLSA